MANIKNLKPIKTLSNDEAKKRGSAGGKRSVEVRREKKLMSQIYADFLSEEMEIEIDEGQRKKMTGAQLVNEMMRRVFMRGDSASVSIMKEIREATEGTKTKLTGEDGGPVEISLIKRVIVGA